MHEFGLAG